MYTVLTNITFSQIPSGSYPARNKTIIYNFVNEFEASDSWADLTNKAKITIPKNVYVRDENGKAVSLSGTNVNVGGFDLQVPLFLKGDKVTIRYGYRYFDKAGNEVSPMVTVFEGYISLVSSKKPIVLECEDNMWKFINNS